MKYTPRPTPQTLEGPEALALWTGEELRNVSRAFQESEQVQFTVLHNEPPRPREGMVVVADGSDWDPGEGYGQYVYLNGAWVSTSVMSVPGREKLVGDKFFFVRTDGSDANSGLSDSAGGAFLTFQHAVDVASVFDFNTHNVTIQAGNEAGTKTFTALTNVNGLVGVNLGNGLNFNGNGSGNTILTNNTEDTFKLNDTGCSIHFNNMTIQNTAGSSSCIKVGGNSATDIGSDVVFGPAGFAHIWVHDNPAKAFMLSSNYTIAGGATSHLFVDGGLVVTEGCTITLSGVPAFFRFVQCNSNGTVILNGTTYTGSGATGRRFYAQQGGVIQTDGAGLNVFPGDQPGIALNGTGGFYSDDGGFTIYGDNSPIPAGGTAGMGYKFSDTANFGIFYGSNVPTLAAAKGSFYLRSDGTTNVTRAYINTDGGTTWTAINTVA